MNTYIKNPTRTQIDMAINILTRNGYGTEELLLRLRQIYQSVAENSIALGDASVTTPEETGLNLLVLRTISDTIEQAG